MNKTADIATVSLPEILPGKNLFMVKGLCELGKDFFEHYAYPHRHDFYSIYWIRAGKLIHTIDTVVHEGKKNTLFFLEPGQVHKMEFSQRVEGIFIAFYDTFLCMKEEQDNFGLKASLFFNEQSCSVLHISDEQAQELEWIVQLMKKEVQQKQDKYELAFKNLLRYFLVIALRAQQDDENIIAAGREYNATLFRKFRILIDQHYEAKKNVSDYADMLHIKPVQLNEISKQVSGLTAGEHIRTRIITEAKRYLFNTGFTSKEIAYKLGFDDPHYFSRFFKKYTAQSPQEFKVVSRQMSAV